MNDQIFIDYHPNPSQAQFHASNATFKLMVGALGSGKSATGCVEGLIRSLEYGGNRGIIARKTLPELRNTTLKRFFDFCPPSVIHSWNKTERELKLKTNDGMLSEVLFMPLDEADRFKSLDLGWFFIDEANECDFDVFRMLMGRLRIHKNYPDGRVLKRVGMLATNPTTTRHWLYKTFVEAPSTDMEMFKSKTEENKRHLPPDYIDTLRRNYSKDWQRRYLDGEWGIVSEGDPIFGDFSVDKHVTPLKPIKGRPMFRGWDFGIRGQFVVFSQLDELGRFRIYRSILKEMDLEEFVPIITQISNEHFYGFEFKDFCDPAGANNRDSALPAVQMLNRFGIFPQFRFSRPRDRHPEIRRLLRSRIGQKEAFAIDPINEYLIEGLIGGYCYKPGSDPFDEQVAPDNYYKHGIDGVGYTLLNTTMMDRPASGIGGDIVISTPKWSYGRKRAGLIG